MTAVADVRSTPWSRFVPDYNQTALGPFLRGVGIHYVFLGEELGARPRDRSCYSGATASYPRIMAHPLFQRGLSRVLSGLEQHTIALMCAEKDPLDCHRAILIGQALRDRVPHFRHIGADGALESHTDLERRLVQTLGLEPPPLFAAPGDWDKALRQAYQLQGERIAYVEDTEAASSPSDLPGPGPSVTQGGGLRS